MIKWIASLFFVISYSCNISSSPAIISPKKMQLVLWDIMRADALAKQLAAADSTKKITIISRQLTAQVFLIHKITEEQFKNSYAYYSHRPDLMKLITDSINAQQSRKIFSDSPQKNHAIFDSSKSLQK